MLKKIIIFIVFSLIALSSGELFAQLQNNSGIGKSGFSEIFYLNSENKDSVDVYAVFSFNISSLALTKTKNNREFFSIAEPSLDITVTDSVGIIKKRISWSAQLNGDSVYSDDIQSQSLHFRLPKQKLSLALNFSEKDGHFSAVDEFVNINFKEIANNHPIFYYNKDGVNYFCGQNGKSLFDKSNVSLILPVNGNEGKNYSVIIRRIKKNDMYANWNFVADETFQAQTKRIGAFSLKNDANSFDFNTANTFYGVEIQIPDGHLAPGAYQLLLINGADTIKKSFYSIWNSVPKFFSKLESAIELSKIVFTDAELSPTLDAKAENRFKTFLDLWNAKFSNSTNLNQAMYEFYRRADIADSEFITTAEKEGAFTDRGKVFILNGRASSVDSQVLANKTTETWIYDNPRKEYYFETISKGVFRLKNVK